MSDTLANKGYPHTVADQWTTPQQMQAQQFGNDMYVPGHRIQRADGTWVQKGVDGQYHPVVNFEGMYDPNKGHYDKNGNFQLNENQYDAQGHYVSGNAGKLTNTPANPDSPFTQFMTTRTPGIIAETQPETSIRQPSQPRQPRPLTMYNPWGQEPQAQYKEDIANVYDKENAQGQLTAQRYWQEANRDPRNLANQDAQAEANQRFTESQQQMNGSDNTSLIGRELVNKDAQPYRQYANLQVANARTAENNANAANINAIEWRKRGAEDQYKYRQNALYEQHANMLSMGPREESEEKKKQPEATEAPAQQQEQTQSRSYVDDVSVQDVLNYLTQTHWDVVSKALGLSENEHVGDWWKKSHESGHTVAQNSDLDNEEYKKAVEQAAQELWNGGTVKVGGKEINAEGKKGVEAYNLLHGVERGGTAHGAENWQDKQHHEKVTDVSKSATTTTTSAPSFNFSSPGNSAPRGQDYNKNLQLGADGFFHF